MTDTVRLAAEDSLGRVVLHVRTASPHPMALETAVRVARAFHSDLESRFVQDERLLALAGMPFAQETSYTSRRRKELSLASLQHDMRCMCSVVQRQVEALARAAEVRLRASGTSVEQISDGGWHVVALAEPYGRQARGIGMQRLIEEEAGLTGVVLVGPHTRRSAGPVVLAAESVERLGHMLAAAKRLTGVGGVVSSEVTALLLGGHVSDIHELAASARGLLANTEDVRLMGVELGHGDVARLADAVQRLKGGFLIGQWRGLAVPTIEALRELTDRLECPLLLLR